MLPDSTTESAPICKICQLPSSGVQFGVLACKSCAAFFRRACLAKKRNPNCKNGTNNCKYLENNKWTCKKCRLDRCLELGMKPEKVQSNRDLLSAVDNYHMEQRKKKFEKAAVLPETMETFLGRPHFLISFEPDKSSPEKFKIDVSGLLNQAMRILMMPQKPDEKLGNLNSLHRLAHGLNQIRKVQKTEVSTLATLNRDTCLWFYENYITTVARWLSNCEQFNKLHFDIQMKILKAIWLIWIRLERTSMTAEMIGRKALADKLFINSFETAISLETFEVDCSWFTNYSDSQMKYLMDFLESDLQTQLLGPLIECKPTDVELAFMLFQLCFQRAGRLLGSEIEEISERLIGKMTDDLHDYYSQDLKLPHYAHRLTQLLKINQDFQKYTNMRKEKVRVAHIFDVFTVEFSDLDLNNEIC